MPWIDTISSEDIEENTAVSFKIGGFELAIYRLDGDEFRATDNICTHAHAYLSEGWFEDGVIECPLHAGCFDVRTGKGLGAPITADLRTYPVRVEAGIVQVELPD